MGGAALVGVIVVGGNSFVEMSTPVNAGANSLVHTGGTGTGGAFLVGLTLT